MSKAPKFLLALSIIAFVSACAQEEEEVIYVEPEPTYSKY